jgi:deoxyhypusine synthase
VPGLLDGAVGTQLWLFREAHKDFELDLLADQSKLAALLWNAKSTGALLVGGGIAKHHTLWWNQYRGGLDYCVQLTTAQEHDGSLSGARLREAISWHKLKPSAAQVTVEGDATLTLPLLIYALYDRLQIK